MSASAPMCCSSLAHPRRAASAAGDVPVAGVVAARSSRCRSPLAVPPARRTISPSAPGSWPRCFACCVADLGSRRRLRHQPARSTIVTSWRRAGRARESIDLLGRARAARRRARRHRAAAALALRPGAHRDPRQRDRRATASASTCCASSSWSTSLPALGTGMVGALIFSAEAAHVARRRVQRQRLDRLRHLHHRDRRHRPDRRADHRHGHLISCCGRRWPISAASI